MMNRRPPKGYYTEMEVAATICVSVDELRTLVRRNITDCDDAMGNLPKTWFQASDVLLLRLLAGQRLHTSLAH